MKRTSWLALTLGIVSLAGCGGAAFYATTPPPPVRVEARGIAPGQGFVWIDGYWGYRGGRYDWVPGRWTRPPHPRAQWVPGQWEHRGNKYRYREGHWR
jgi:WXXGXW repeat (2 copies)